MQKAARAQAVELVMGRVPGLSADDVVDVVFLV